MSLVHPKNLLVTGANGGIGRAIVNKLIDCGFTVIAVDLTPIDRNIFRSEVHVEQCDISNAEQIETLWANFSKKKIKVDSLVNNAAIYLACDWQNYSPDLAQKVLNTNILGSFLMSQAFARQTDEGAIINIASVAAFSGSSDPLYGASKSGLIGLTKSLALSLAPKIRVNAIAPSIVSTPMMDKIPEEILEKYRKRELLSPGITPEAVADAVIFLAGSMSRHITGSTIDLNNGLYLR